MAPSKWNVPTPARHGEETSIIRPREAHGARHCWQPVGSFGAFRSCRDRVVSCALGSEPTRQSRCCLVLARSSTAFTRHRPSVPCDPFLPVVCSRLAHVAVRACVCWLAGDAEPAINGCLAFYSYHKLPTRRRPPQPE